MRSWLKSLATSILVGKSDRVLAQSSAFRILIIGGDNRFIMREEISKKLPGTVITNKSGYTYKLGLALTVLNQRAGFHSVYRWIQIVFSKYSQILIDYYVIDFKISDHGDAKFFAKHFQPDVVILADLHKEMTDNKLYKEQIVLIAEALPNCLIISPELLSESMFPGANIIYYGLGESNTIRLIERTEHIHGQTFRYRVDQESGQVNLSNYGEHYLYPILIASYINSHEMGKKK